MLSIDIKQTISAVFRMEDVQTKSGKFADEVIRCIGFTAMACLGTYAVWGQPYWQDTTYLYRNGPSTLQIETDMLRFALGW